MDPTLQAILDSLPPKVPRSRLEPYRELIREMRRRGRTYREIAQVLAERCEVTVAPSTVHDFVRVRSQKSKAKPPPALAEAAVSADPRLLPEATGEATKAAEKSPNPDEARRRIEALKQRSVTPAPAKKVFEYNPEEPLRLLPHSSKKSE